MLTDHHNTPTYHSPEIANLVNQTEHLSDDYDAVNLQMPGLFFLTLRPEVSGTHVLLITKHVIQQ